MTYRFSLRSIRAGAVAAVSAVVLVGCNGGTEVEDPPTTASPSAPTSSPESSPSPTELESTEEPTTEGPTDEPTEASALPELPEAAKENTPEGAEAFIRYYFDVVNRAYTTPESGLIPALSNDECLACVALEEQVGQLISSGQRVAYEPFALTDMSVVGGGAEPEVVRFNVEMTQPANQFIDSDDNVVLSSEAMQKSGVVAAIWEGEAWKLYGSGLQ